MISEMFHIVPDSEYPASSLLLLLVLPDWDTHEFTGYNRAYFLQNTGPAETVCKVPDGFRGYDRVRPVPKKDRSLSLWKNSGAAVKARSPEQGQ